MSGSFNPANFFNPTNLISNVALTAVTGGGSLYAQLTTQIFSSMGSQLLQQFGQQLNLPQSFISQQQDGFSASVRGFEARVGVDRGGSDSAIADALTQSGASPAEIGEAHRTQQSWINQYVRDVSESQEFREAKANRSGGRGVGGASTTNAPGWLMAMAEALGRKLDEMAADMEHRAANISEKDPSSSAEFGVVSQQFSMLMNATNTAIKTIGEALGGMARKQ